MYLISEMGPIFYRAPEILLNPWILLLLLGIVLCVIYKK